MSTITPKQLQQIRQALASRVAHLAAKTIPAIAHAASARGPENINTNVSGTVRSLARSLELLTAANMGNLDVIHLSQADRTEIAVGISSIAGTMTADERDELDAVIANL